MHLLHVTVDHRSAVSIKLKALCGMQREISNTFTLFSSGKKKKAELKAKYVVEHRATIKMFRDEFPEFDAYDVEISVRYISNQGASEWCFIVKMPFLVKVD